MTSFPLGFGVSNSDISSGLFGSTILAAFNAVVIFY
jgi:hypothetical protein